MITIPLYSPPSLNFQTSHQLLQGLSVAELQFQKLPTKNDDISEAEMDVDMDMDTSPSHMNPKDLTVREQFRYYGYTSHYHISIPPFFFVLKIFQGLKESNKCFWDILSFALYIYIYFKVEQVKENHSNEVHDFPLNLLVELLKFNFHAYLHRLFRFLNVPIDAN